jgi:nucleoside-diphosphate kinase
MERTLVLIKPDAIQRGLIGKIVDRFETKGLKLIGCKMMSLSDALLKEHYAHIAEKPFFGGIASFMSSSPVIAMCWEGLEVVETVRRLCGITKAREAEAGSIRGDFAMSIQCNVVHASDSLENAQKEVDRFFKPEDIFEYDKAEYMHIYSEDERAV